MTVRRVIITRPREHAGRLAAALRARDIEPVIIPAVVFAPPASHEPFDDAIQHLDRYQWILFTSQRGVRVFIDRLVAASGTLPEHIRWAAVGPGTAEALRTSGAADVWTPSRFLSEAVGAELPAQPGDRILRIRAETASPLPAQRLRSRGVHVDEVVAYRTVEAPPESVPLLLQAFGQPIDGVIFTSASTVRGFAALSRAAGVEHQVHHLQIIAIGPVTADAIRAQGWPVHLVAGEYSLDGIVRVLNEHHVAPTNVPLK